MTSSRRVPRRRFLRVVGMLSMALFAACVASPAISSAAPPPPSAAAGDVFFSPTASVIQAQSPAGMRTFLSTDHPEYTMQSYVWAGSLVDAGGRLNTFAFCMQRNNESIHGSPLVPVITSAALFNRSSDPGFVVGGLAGIADLTLPLSLTTRPWSVRAQSFTLGQPPDFIDVRVVEGVLGKKGAVYEFTSLVPNGAEGAPANQLLVLYVRAQDTTGIMQWGYGPSGFFPQWIYPSQRAAITNDFGNSVGKYLEGTYDPMTNQGDYYYTMPLLKVQRFSVSLGGQVVSTGSSGWLWFDNVEQQFDAAAEQIISNGVNWLEFSVQFPTTKQAMKIGYVEQASVGQLNYAMLHDAHSPKARNGAFTDSVNWDMDKVHITPVQSSLWKSPVSGQSYYTSYRVTLDGARPRQRAHLFIAAKFTDQEVNAGGRHVYEGLFSITGTLCGEKVSGQAWTEVQPSGNL
jgi:hypothetical protein